MDVKESLNLDFEKSLPKELKSLKIIYSVGIFYELSRLITYYDKEFSIIRDSLDKGNDLLKPQGIFFQ